jgi:hypothetical protein
VYSGGVGEDDMNYIKSIQHNYNLKLMFTENNGVFLADMPVRITDRGGNTVVDTVTKGPILLVNLQPGTYTVSATDAGMTREQKITVSDRGLRGYQLHFPSRDERADDMGAGSQ